MSSCNCNTPSLHRRDHEPRCPMSAPAPDYEIQVRPRTPQEYRAYVQGFLYGVKMAEEAKHDLPTEIALETIVEGYRQMVGYPGVAPEGAND